MAIAKPLPAGYKRTLIRVTRADDPVMFSFLALKRDSDKPQLPSIESLIMCGNSLLGIPNQCSNRLMMEGVGLTLQQAQLIRCAGMLRAHGLIGYHSAHEGKEA